tara:strand:+ start:247 stop:2046 length:1800 start_codon:yes stop_codon:yes gene_type:complete
MGIENLDIKNYREIVDNAASLVAGRPSKERQVQKARIKAILNGGPDGMKALLGNKMETSDADLLPAPNMLQSGIDRLAQKISGIPQVRVDILNHNSSDRAKFRAEKLERIVTSYDEKQNLSLQLGQAARWLPGYGYCAWIITTRTDKNGYIYPTAELRDPYDTFPGNFGPDQEPRELAVLRRIPRYKLAQLYPEFAKDILNPDESESTESAYGPGGGSIGTGYDNQKDNNWEDNTGQGVRIIEYYDAGGTYVVFPEKKMILDFIPNFLSGTPFIFMKRISFDELKGQYDHVIGLMAMMAKINIMSAIAMEDSVFTETNISGELESGQYRKGRFAINYLAPGTQVSKPQNNIPYQLFQQIDRLERQLRMVGGYPVTDDSQSPNSFVTGAGLSELNSTMSLMINEYREIIKHGLQKMDEKRLELDSLLAAQFPELQKKPIQGFYAGTAFSENYSPIADIGGDYRTRRVYGVMAGFDEPQKIVTGLQLLQAGVIDVETLQDNIDGLDNIAKVQERIRKNKAENVLFESVLARSAEGDPAATQAVIAIYEFPAEMTEILRLFYTPQEPQLTPEEEAFMAQQNQQMMPQQAGPPGIQQALMGGM